MLSGLASFEALYNTPTIIISIFSKQTIKGKQTSFLDCKWNGIFQNSNLIYLIRNEFEFENSILIGKKLPRKFLLGRSKSKLLKPTFFLDFIDSNCLSVCSPIDLLPHSSRPIDV